MLVFIDESGDAGFKITSSKCLLISLIIFDDYAEADKTREVIRQVMQATRQKPEFKFSRSNNTNRDAFFVAMQPCKFRVRFICLSKEGIHSDHLRNNPARFYNYALKSLIQYAGLKNAKVRIDGNGKKELNTALKKYITQHSSDGAVHSLKFMDSCKQELIQLADMVVGALARPYNSSDKKDTDRWAKAIKNKIDKGGEWIFR